MKNILNLMVFTVVAVFTQVASAHSYDAASRIYGWWDVETPLVDNGFVYSTGQIYFDDQGITFETSCSFHGGLEMKAQVSSPVSYSDYDFIVLQNQQAVTRSGNATCEASLAAGPIEYILRDSRHMEIFNRNSGFHMELVK